MHEFLVEMLECPSCHGSLEWRVGAARAGHVERAEAVCSRCGASYPVRDGIGLFLTPDLARHDLWQEVESQLAQYLKEHPQVRALLMESPLETLPPADRFYRAMALEEEGHFKPASEIIRQTLSELYSPEYLANHELEMGLVIERLADGTGPVIDLASGRGQLVERLARSLARPVVASDFSPRVLRRNRRWILGEGLDDRVTLLAFDARRTPFRPGSVQTMTTNLGLPNIEQPGQLLRELRRIVGGTLLAISIFYPEEDEANGAVIRQAGLAPLLYRQSALQQFTDAGWKVESIGETRGPARPTPTSVLLEGAGIDGLPVAETTLEWCTLVAR
ncbi:MAG: methyltransferase domain-containing protein [Chloroflexota bacterium]